MTLTDSSRNATKGLRMDGTFYVAIARTRFV
jgi:hypothetical protein